MPTAIDGASVLLKVCRQPPLSVFFGEAFEIEVVVEGEGDGSKPCDASFEIGVSLSKEDSFCRLILLQPSNIQTGVAGILHCSIHEAAREKTSTPSFYEGPLVVSARRNDVITSVSTANIIVARYKIVATPAADWTSVWYKDEGGREKCITVMAGK